jgi:hypothetical protein
MAKYMLRPDAEDLDWYHDYAADTIIPIAEDHHVGHEVQKKLIRATAQLLMRTCDEVLEELTEHVCPHCLEGRPLSWHKEWGFFHAPRDGGPGIKCLADPLWDFIGPETADAQTP